MRKRCFAAMLALLLVLSPAAASGAPRFPDAQGSWAKDEISWVAGLGALQGYPDESFRPEGTISRAEFVAALVRALDLTTPTDGAAIGFTDVTATDWYAGPLRAALAAGIVRVEDFGERFGGGGAISRGEIARMVARAVEDKANRPPEQVDFSDVPAVAPIYGVIRQAAGYAILKGYPDGTFQPDRTASRAEAAVMLLRTLRAIPPTGPYAESAAEPIFPIRQMLLGMMISYRFHPAPYDLSALRQFATAEVVERAQRALQDWRKADGPAVYYRFEADAPGIKLFTRDRAVIEQPVLVVRYAGDKAYLQTAQWTWWVAKRGVDWIVTDVDSFAFPSDWYDLKDRTEAVDVLFSFTENGRTYFGRNTFFWQGDPVPENLPRLFEEAHPGTLRIYAISGQRWADTKYAGQIRSLYANPPRPNHSGQARILGFAFGEADLRFTWVSRDEIAERVLGSFLDPMRNKVVSIDGVPWEKVADDGIWMELRKETPDTIGANSPKYRPRIEQLLRR